MFWGCFVSNYVVRAFTLLKEGLAEAFPNGGSSKGKSAEADLAFISKTRASNKFGAMFWKTKPLGRFNFKYGETVDALCFQGELRHGQFKSPQFTCCK